jgi:hypothetical protein
MDRPVSDGPMSDGCVCFSSPHADNNMALIAMPIRCERVPNVLCMSLT